MMKDINADIEKHIISWQDLMGLISTLAGTLPAPPSIPLFKPQYFQSFSPISTECQYNIIVQVTFSGSRNMLILTKDSMR